MVASAVTCISLLIAFIDIREHRIRNTHLLLLAIPLSITRYQISWIEILVFVLLTLVISLVFRVGGGDFKLFSLLIATQGELIASAIYFYLFAISVSVSSAISLVIRRNLSASIPLAPAILAPFLYLYLAI